MRTVYPVLTTGLVWPHFRNQSTIICAVIPPNKCPIQPLFKLRGTLDIWYHTFWSQLSTSTRTHLPNRKHIFTPRATVRACARRLSQIRTSHRFQRDDSWLPANPKWAHLHPRHPPRHRKSGEWTESDLPRHSGTLGNGITGSGVSAALIESGCCRSCFYIITRWCSFEVSFSSFLWAQCSQQKQIKLRHNDIKLIMLVIIWTIDWLNNDLDSRRSRQSICWHMIQIKLN